MEYNVNMLTDFEDDSMHNNEVDDQKKNEIAEYNAVKN